MTLLRNHHNPYRKTLITIITQTGSKKADQASTDNQSQVQAAIEFLIYDKN